VAADDITFNLVVNTGTSDANIKAINTALSDFGRVALRAEGNAKSVATALDRWISSSKAAASGVADFASKLNLSTSKANSATSALNNLAKAQRRVQRDTAGNISATPAANNASRTSNGNTRVQRPAGPPTIGATAATGSFEALDAQQKSNIATTDRLSSSTDRLNKNLKTSVDQSAALRYALYDLSNAAALTAAGLIAFPLLAAKSAIDAELAFANVARTTGVVGQEAETLKNQFLELSQALPTSFGEVSAVGTLAGQLGVANDELESFVKNTIQFSTVSSLSSEESATAFARLNQLIPSVNGNYEALGSAILKVGTESAATESEIVAVAQQIAPVANSFNMSAASVIGLSGAFASLKVPPELSRGALQRTFAEINQAISTGSSTLEEYGRVSGMTGQQFKDAFLSNSTDAFVNLLRGIDKEGGAAEGTLVRLGITASRDAATLKRLAQNVDGTLVPALENATEAYGSADEQQKQFDKIAQTLAKRLEQLASNFNNFITIAGSGVSAFGGLIDVINGFLGFLTDIANNPFGRYLLGIIGGVTIFVGVLLGFAAIALRVRASIIAMNQSIAGLSAGLVQARAAAAATSGGLGTLGTVAAATGVSVKALRLALISTGIGALVVAIGTVAGGLIEMASAGGNATQSAEAMFGSFGDLRSAMEADAKAAKDTGAAVLSYSSYLRNAGKEVDSTGRIVDSDTTKRAENADVIDKQTAALNGYGVAIGEATRQKIADAFIKSEDFKQIDEWNQRMSEIGQTQYQVDISKVLNFVSSGDNAGLQKYLDDTKAQITNSIQSLDGESLGAMFNEDELFLGLFGDTTAAKAEQTFGAVENAAEATMTAIGIAGAEAGSTIDSWVTGAGNASNSTEEWAQNIDDVSNGMKEIKDQASKGFTMTEAIDASVSSYQDLLDALSESGGSLDQGFEGGRNSAQAFQSAIVDTIGLAEGMGLTAAEGVNIVYSNMIANGANAADVQLQLNGLVQSGVISSVQMSQIMGGTLAMSPQAAGLASQFGKLSANVGGAAKKMVTLTDYANDLSSVWKRAFDIRFSGQSTLDDITSAFQDISDTTKDAKQNINDLQADLDSLTADKALQEYFLSVANAYGDTLAAAQIQAKLNKINNEITGTNEDLADAQGDANKTLVGNSAAAIKNRQTITGLVSTYQSHIQALAASGMGQEELAAQTAKLKQDFLDQATQLGYNRGELDTYAAAFDDVSTAIANVPRNVNVTANTNPALQALNEFTAKAKAAGGAAGSGWASAFGEQAAKASRGTAIQNRVTALQAEAERARKNGASSQAILGYGYQMLALNNQLASGNYATGGYVSGPGGPTSDSINARLSNGEYVMRAAAVNRYGVGFMNQLNQMQTPRFANGGLVSMSQSPGGMVSLSPEDRALLRNVGGSGDIVLYANNEAIARSSNAGNRAIVATGGLP
jgi:TP901 family phage tail tape measure protein